MFSGLTFGWWMEENTVSEMGQHDEIGAAIRFPMSPALMSQVISFPCSERSLSEEHRCRPQQSPW